MGCIPSCSELSRRWTIPLVGTELEHVCEVSGVAGVHEGTVGAYGLLLQLLYGVLADTELGMDIRSEERDFTPTCGFGRATPSLETHHRASGVHSM